MDSFIKFVGHNEFQRKRIEKKGLSFNQWKAYRDFSNNFESRKNAIEEQLQMPINKALTKKEIINLYQASFKSDRFTIKTFSNKTGINENTTRRELSNGVRRGVLERVDKGVYRYK